jgi:sec-independent protein translocase protein TatA
MFEGIMRPMHLVVILIIALLFFGPSKLAGLGKGLGDAIKNFKGAMKEGDPEPQQPPAEPVEKK